MKVGKTSFFANKFLKRKTWTSVIIQDSIIDC